MLTEFVWYKHFIVYLILLWKKAKLSNECFLSCVVHFNDQMTGLQNLKVTILQVLWAISKIGFKTIDSFYIPTEVHDEVWPGNRHLEPVQWAVS